jgi:predicted NBD/HSP70 family sugar kinase
LRQANERLVLNTIRRNPGISRSEISRITGFSRTSVTFVVNRLLQDGLVREDKKENGAGSGRPPTGLWLRAGAMTAIGVEITPPESIVLLVGLDGEILEQRTVAWRENPQIFLDNLAVAIRAVGASRASRRVLGAGVSLPGTIEKSSGRVIAAESIGWFDVDVGKRLKRRVDWPLFFENDANLSALAEQWYSPADGALLRYFVYVRMQGGLGSGVVVDGRILHGASSAGAELGHIMLYPEGRPCSCGNRGCWEQYASEAALVRAYRELAGGSGVGDSRMRDESSLIVRLAREGDKHALSALRTTATYLALGFVNVIAALNPQAIIMGEPIASAWDLIEDVVQAELRRRVPPYYLNGLRLLPSRIDRHSALRGAAALALAHFFTHFDHTKDDALPNGVAMEAHG